jgi:hypothetical protein
MKSFYQLAERKLVGTVTGIMDDPSGLKKITVNFEGKNVTCTADLLKYQAGAAPPPLVVKQPLATTWMFLRHVATGKYVVTRLTRCT